MPASKEPAHDPPALDHLARTVANWFGCGRSPVGPGTVGSIGALPLHLTLKCLGPGPYLLGTLAIIAVGYWASERTASLLDQEDPQEVVIDEVAGTLLAMGLCRGRGVRTELLSLVVFRVLDIVKPGVIDRVQHLKPAGLGIMADDVLAGLAAGALTRLLTGR